MWRKFEPQTNTNETLEIRVLWRPFTVQDVAQRSRLPTKTNVTFSFPPASQPQVGCILIWSPAECLPAGIYCGETLPRTNSGETHLARHLAVVSVIEFFLPVVTMSEDTPNDVERAAVGGEPDDQPGPPGDLSTPTQTGNKALLISPIPAMILSALVAILVWGALQIILPVFQLPEHLRELSGNAPEAQQKELLEASVTVSNRNAALSLGLLASTLALFLTVAEVKFRRQGLRAIWGGLLAILIAGVFGAGGGILGGVFASSSVLPENPFAATIIVQGTMLGFVGLGVGLGLALAVSLPKFQPRLLATCLIGGMLGGLLSGLIFPLSASVLLPNARTEVLMPDPGFSRSLWLGLASITIALTLTGIGKEETAGA